MDLRLVISFLGAIAPLMKEDLPTPEHLKSLMRREMYGELKAEWVKVHQVKWANPLEAYPYRRLWAEYLGQRGEWAASTGVWRELIEEWGDSLDLWANYLRSLNEWGESETDTLLKSRVKTLLQRFIDRARSDSSLKALYCGWLAAQYLGVEESQERALQLVKRYPTHQEGIQVARDLFWDGLYPVWDNPKGRVEYLSRFISQFPQSPFSWLAYRFLAGAQIATGDTSGAFMTLSRWVEAAPHPWVLFQAASLWSEAKPGESWGRIWAEEALKAGDSLNPPLCFHPEEWALYAQSTRAGIPLLVAEWALKEGDLAKAESIATFSLQTAIYGVDEEATTAPQHLLLGKIAWAKGDSDQAAYHWVEALIQGDRVNFWASQAESLIAKNWNLEKGKQVLKWAREKRGYQDITFDEVTEKVGLGGVSGSRLAWGDYDNDGDDDLLIGGTRLFRNDGGSFTETTQESGLNGEGCHGGIWGDWDGDGWLDLFLFSSSSDSARGERLYRNLGNGTFQEVGGEVGVLPDPFTTEAAIWVDLNRDGQLDLYIASYEKPAGTASELGRGYPDRVLVQNEQGHFRDWGAQLGLVPPSGKNYCGRSPVACDFDQDGDQDLYLGNYRLQRNFFWVNESGHFSERGAWYEVEGDEVEGWYGHTIGCEWGDFDGDGDFDLIVCNLAHPRYIWFSNRTMLYLNEGPDRPMRDVRREWKIRYDECHSEPVWGDFDNDGDLDLFITCVYPSRRSYLYRNDGESFTDITYLAGARYFNGWGCATADFDNDGRLDLGICSDGKFILLRNTTREPGNWLKVDGRSLQIGDIVQVEGDGRLWIRQVEGGKGAGSQNSLTLHFGFGKHLPNTLRLNGKVKLKGSPLSLNQTLLLK